MITLVLRNVTDVKDHLAVNFMDGWKLLISSRKLVKCSSLCGQIANISSIYLHHMVGVLSTLARICLSWSSMNMFAYEGAICLPIAIPFFVCNVHWWRKSCFISVSTLLILWCLPLEVLIHLLYLATSCKPWFLLHVGCLYKGHWHLKWATGFPVELWQTEVLIGSL